MKSLRNDNNEISHLGRLWSPKAYRNLKYRHKARVFKVNLMICLGQAIKNKSLPLLLSHLASDAPGWSDMSDEELNEACRIVPPPI